MSGGSSKQESQQTSKTYLDPDFKTRYMTNLDKAGTTAENLKAREFAGFTPEQMKGFGITEKTATEMPGGRTLGAGVAAAEGAGLTPQSINTFLNPYTKNVVDTTLADIARQRDIALTQNMSDTAAAKAFGNTRRPIVEAAVVDPYARAAASEAGKLYSGAYDQATEAAAKASGIDLSKAETLKNLGLSQQNVGYQAGEKMAEVGAQKQQLTQAQMDAIRNLPLEQQQIINEALKINPGGGAGMITESQGTSSGGSKQSIWGAVGL